MFNHVPWWVDSLGKFFLLRRKGDSPGATISGQPHKDTEKYKGAGRRSQGEFKGVRIEGGSGMLIVTMVPSLLALVPENDCDDGVVCYDCVTLLNKQTMYCGPDLSLGRVSSNRWHEENQSNL